MNLAHEIIKLTEENIGSMLTTVLVMIFFFFLHLTPKGKVTKAKISGATLSQNLLLSKGPSTNEKTASGMEENISRPPI